MASGVDGQDPVMEWEVWRQDDHGNRFLVDRLPSRALARIRLEQLTRSPHKQFYWISATGSGVSRPAECSKEDPH